MNRRQMLGSSLGGLVLLPLGCGPTAVTTNTSKTQADKVELNTVSYAGLNAAVAEQKGKVVVIDVWFRG